MSAKRKQVPENIEEKVFDKTLDLLYPMFLEWAKKTGKITHDLSGIKAWYEFLEFARKV